MRRLILPILCCLILSGCWNYEDTDHRLIVAGAAIDLGDEGETIVTAEVLTFSTGENTVKESYLLTGRGRTVSEAFQDILKDFGKELYFEHATTLIIGADYARNGLQELFDYILNDHELRMTLDLTVSGLNKGSDVFSLTSGDEKVTSFAITSIVGLGEKLGYCSRLSAYDAINGYMQRLRDFTIPLIIAGESDVLRVSGCAAFQGDRMVGTINIAETQNVMLLDNKLEAMQIQLETEEIRSSISLGNFKSKTELLYTDHGLAAKIYVCAEYEVQMSVETTEMDRKIRMQKIEQMIRNRMETVFLESAEHFSRMESDVFGWGERLFRKNPEVYMELVENPNIFLMPQIEFQLELSSKVEGIVGSKVEQEET